jgi:hypothetical protein
LTPKSCWEDLNGDGKPSPGKVAAINFGYQLHTAVEVPVARLCVKLTGSQRLLPASDVEVRPASATVRPRQSATLMVRVAAPRDAAPTAHERAVLLSVNGTT